MKERTPGLLAKCPKKRTPPKHRKLKKAESGTSCYKLSHCVHVATLGRTKERSLIRRHAWGSLEAPPGTSSRRNAAEKTPHLNQGRSWASPIGLLSVCKQRQHNSPTLTPASDLPDLPHLEALERGRKRLCNESTVPSRSSKGFHSIQGGKTAVNLLSAPGGGANCPGMLGILPN